MRRSVLLLLTLLAGGGLSSTGQADESNTAHSQNPTQRLVTADPKMPEALGLDFSMGAGVFKTNWVAAPASTQAVDGLGPLYNARSCNACHPGGTRSRDLTDLQGKPVPGLLVHLSQVIAGKAGPDSVYGQQIQTSALANQQPEARLSVRRVVGPQVTLADGTAVQLYRTEPALTDLAFGPLSPGTSVGLRIGPAMHGLGLLERIPEQAILAQVGHEAGVSGRPNQVMDIQSGKMRLGRFGWKASQPSLMQQNAHAFAIDIGMSNRDFPAGSGDCTAAEKACMEAPNGNSPQFGNVEIADSLLDLVDTFTRYARLPKVPAPADAATLAAGRKVFAASGCTSCHRPSFDLPASANAPAQRIAPYTDLLLHKMGPGLADGVVEGGAEGHEWRTAPLWGLGRAVTADAEGALLHDGRAATILEAILWHGGEAQAAQQRVVALSTVQRESLIAFLRSL
ncbi:MAG TPA: di-heme oxidoredictase family protein [Dongiaceae bacterium]|nr:di-heme oxidoredictase family protein [Dongiaceae bacterium]